MSPLVYGRMKSIFIWFFLGGNFGWLKARPMNYFHPLFFCFVLPLIDCRVGSRIRCVGRLFDAFSCTPHLLFSRRFCSSDARVVVHNIHLYSPRSIDLLTFFRSGGSVTFFCFIPLGILVSGYMPHRKRSAATRRCSSAEVRARASGEEIVKWKAVKCGRWRLRWRTISARWMIWIYTATE